LSQVQDGQEQIIAYYCKRLNKAERNYCVTWQELLRTLEHFLKYKVGENDVPDFNEFLHKFDTTQINTISTDEKENSQSFFQTHHKCTMCAPRITQHTSSP
jgi:glucose-6-phosphate isomerase